MTTETPPPGFRPLESRSPFVNRAGRFYVSDDAGGSSVGTFIGHDQSNSEGYAHGGFLLTFADFALTILTNGITLNLTTDFLRPARQGDWVEARINVRKRSDSLIFADAIVVANGHDLLRVGGLFRPFDKRR